MLARSFEKEGFLIFPFFCVPGYNTYHDNESLINDNFRRLKVTFLHNDDHNDKQALLETTEAFGNVVVVIVVVSDGGGRRDGHVPGLCPLPSRYPAPHFTPPTILLAGAVSRALFQLWVVDHRRRCSRSSSGC